MGVSQKGYDAEITALDILEQEDYEIIDCPTKNHRKKEILKEKIKELETKLEDFGYSSNYVKKQAEGFETLWYTHKDKRKLEKRKDMSIKDKQKHELASLIKTWDMCESQKQTEIKNVDEIQNLLNKIIGKSLLPKSSAFGKEYSIDEMDEGYFSEPWNIKFRIRNKKTLEKDKRIPYVTFHTPERVKSDIHIDGMVNKAIRIIRPTIKEIENEIVNYSSKKGYFELWKGFMEITSTLDFHTYVDVFCKKGNNYYVFDVKHKTFKEDKNPNQFTVTNYEVLNYAKIIKENKVKLKIVIIVEKANKTFYKIFNWMDFHVPTSFDPHKNRKTSIRLKEGFDLSKFQEWKYN